VLLQASGHAPASAVPAVMGKCGQDNRLQRVNTDAMPAIRVLILYYMKLVHQIQLQRMHPAAAGCTVRPCKHVLAQAWAATISQTICSYNHRANTADCATGRRHAHFADNSSSFLTCSRSTADAAYTIRNKLKWHRTDDRLECGVQSSHRALCC
jgi:hypothetical protein